MQPKLTVAERAYLRRRVCALCNQPLDREWCGSMFSDNLCTQAQLAERREACLQEHAAASQKRRERLENAKPRRAEAFALRESGLTFRQVGERMGVSEGRARELWWTGGGEASRPPPPPFIPVISRVVMFVDSLHTMVFDQRGALMEQGQYDALIGKIRAVYEGPIEWRMSS